MADEVRKFTYDKDGNMISDGKGIYKYDSLDRMSEAVMNDGGKLLCRYDAEGLRHETEENGKLIKFIYSGRDAVCEEADETYTRYIRGNGRIVASDCEQARTYYHYVCDSLGSVTHMLSGNEYDCSYNGDDVSRRLLCRYEYDAFGNTVSAKEDVTNRYGFAGEMRDGITGQYYLRARYYMPEIGRFTQAYTYHGDGLNLYVYAGSNPVMYVDPSGHECGKPEVSESDTSSRKFAENVMNEGTEENYPLYRQKTNTGPFFKLKESMSIENIRMICDNVGIDYKGIRVNIIKDLELIGRGIFGYTHPEGNVVDLYPDAFKNKETLVKTLGHERTHVEQIRKYGPPKDSDTCGDFENEAILSEEYWWELYKSKNGDS